MSDDDRFLEEDSAVSEDTQSGRKVGILPAVLIKILKWTALILAAVIFIVTVVVITVQFLNGGNNQRSAIAVTSEAYEGRPPVLEYFNNIGEVRCRTSDEATYTVLIEPSIGYDPKNKQLQTELISRTPQLRDMVRAYFSSKTADQLRPENETALKLELKEMINRLLTQGKIKEIIFPSFNVIPM